MLPTWTEADIALAKATQAELGVPVVGLSTKIAELKGQEEIPEDEKRGGGSDDIGDISWTVPTVSLRFPANFQAGPGHNWANAISMATPIAHKGVNAGAQVVAMTIMDALLRPDVIVAAKDYFTNVQTKNRKYTPLIRETDTPAIELNREIMAKYKPELQKRYYDPTKYKTYLEQLGITYPTVRKPESKTTAQ